MVYKKLLFRKSKGDVVTDLAIPLITLIIIGVLLVATLSFVKENKRLDDMDRIGRQYMLHMESDGYLTDANKQSLISKLESIGAKSISLSGTTTSSVEYGNEINLMISCDIEIDTINMKGFTVDRQKETVNYSDTWTSTAKN